MADPPHRPQGGPGRPSPHRRREGRPAPDRVRVRAGAGRGAGRHRAGDGARRQGGRVLPQAPPRRHRPGCGGPRARRARALRVHLRGRQQPLVRADGPGCRDVGLAARAHVALVDQVADMAGELRGIPMLAHTHGQPATPTTLGKELAVLATRLRRQLRRVGHAEYLGKLNGATGTYGAHLAAVPDADWPRHQPVVRRGAGAQLEPAHHADRESRLAGRAVCGPGAVQPGDAQPLHRRVDVHLARLLRAGPRPGDGRARRRCRTR